MFTGTDKEYREAVRLTNEYGAQLGDLLNKIEGLGVGVVTTRGPAAIVGPNFIIRRIRDRWTYTS